MSETWYEAWMDKITPVEVERHTELSVWVHGRKHARKSWRAYFPTWDGAREWLLSKAQDELDSARRSLQRAQAKHGRIKGMRQPSEVGESR